MRGLLVAEKTWYQLYFANNLSLDSANTLPVFVAGRERTSAPFARFFFHEYDWGFEKRQTLHQIDEAVKRLRSDIEMARNILKSRTKLPNKFLQAIKGRAVPAVIGPEEAQKFGLVDEICQLRNISRDGIKPAVWTC